MVRVERAAARRVTPTGSCAATAEWDARWWSPIISAEHLAMRERVGLVDLSAFAIFDVTRPGRPGLPQGLVVGQMDVPVGRVVYTPLLNAAGGIVADLTIMRLGQERFRVVTGGGMGMRDKKWFVDHLPDRRLGPALRRHLGRGRPSASGGRARATSSPSVTDGRRLATPASRSAPAGPSTSAAIRTLASRISLRRRAGLGDLRPDGGGPPALGRCSSRPARPHGIVAGRHRRLRHDRPAREGLPRPRQRARARLRPGRGRHGPAEGQGRPTSSAGRPTSSSDREAAGRRSCAR